MNKWAESFKVILYLTALSFLVSFFIGSENLASGNVALIEIKGPITSEAASLFGERVADSPTIVSNIEAAGKNPSVKAIVLEINSPGGSAVASEEIAAALNSVNKTKIAWIREVGASGAYWIASAADTIVASRASFTGSIGVIASYLEFSGLLTDYNISYQRLISGKYKDLGSPFKSMSAAEEALMQKKLDSLHEYFMEEVAKNRGMPRSKVREVATGEFFLGTEAKNLGLVDVLGGKKEVHDLLKKELNETPHYISYKKEKGFFDMLGEVMGQQSFNVGRGIGSSLGEREARLDIKT